MSEVALRGTVMPSTSYFCGPSWNTIRSSLGSGWRCRSSVNFSAAPNDSKASRKSASESRQSASWERGTIVEPMRILLDLSTRHALRLTDRYPIAPSKADTRIRGNDTDCFTQPPKDLDKAAKRFKQQDHDQAALPQPP